MANTYHIEDCASRRDPREATEMKLRQRLKPITAESYDNSRICYRVVRKTAEDGHVSMYAEHGLMLADGTMPTRWEKLTEAVSGKGALESIMNAVDRDFRSRVRTVEYLQVEPMNGN